ncbi:MAG: nucleotidyltransferase family protein [Candidatus Eremiobacteraeota bacterium]|nr:nucleotidyltransferase family protein [Candidatus Eremiobacteraeota bacterium]MCW5872462.1 nucleotidyltransferase family protein [Candidatus Eremiobacteraeota bacterium]
MSADFCHHFLTRQPTIQPPPEPAEALQEGLDGLVAVVLARQGSELPPFYRQALNRHFARNAGHLSELTRIGQAFHQRGLRALVLKGASLLGKSYPELAARPMGDLDLLVRPQDEGKARLILRSLGYRQGRVCLVGPGAMVDLHTRLMGWESVAPANSPYDFAAGRLWSQARETERAGILRLCPEHQVLHLAVHALKHGYQRLLWLVDLALVLPEAEPELLLREARVTRSLRPLAYACHLIGRSGPSLGWLERVCLHWIYCNRSQRSAKLLMALSLPPAARLTYLAQLAFPPRAQSSSELKGLPGWCRHLRRLSGLVREAVGGRVWR